MKKYLGLIIVILLSWWAIGPLFHRFMFPIHDNTQVVRVYEMAKALKDGQFPVRWVADLGYGFGYPIFNFYSPLPYYVGALFVILGFDVLVATKLMFIIGILAAGIFMYCLAREFWGEWGGIISGLLFMYTPYHAVQIYVRGAVGEFWALAFIPLLALGFYKVTVEHRWKWVILGSLGYAGVILSHNIIAMILTIFLAPFLILSFFYKPRISPQRLIPNYQLLITILLGLSFSAFFWLPAITEMGLTKVLGQIGGGADFRDHFVYLDQLWTSLWGFGGSAPGRLDGMSFMIGKLHIILSIFALLTAIYYWQKERSKSLVILFSLFSFLFSIFMMLEVSQPIWEAIPLLAFIQYPWRFLVFVIFSASFAAGAIVLWLRKSLYQALLAGAIIFLVLVFNTKYFKPKTYFNFTAAGYINDENIKWETSRVSDEYLPRDFVVPQNKNETVKEKLIPSSEVILAKIKILSSQYQFETQAAKEGKVLIRTAYFPGWQVFIDGKKMDQQIQNGQISIVVPSGEHQVKVIFSNAAVRTIGNLVSLLSGLVLFGGFLYGWKKKT